MENAIEIKSLRKIFRGAKGAKTEVLRGVDFNVRKGEIWLKRRWQDDDHKHLLDIAETRRRNRDSERF